MLPNDPEPGRERGVGLVELIVVVLIIMILMLAGLSTMRSSRAASHDAVVRSTALAYAAAVEQFAADHGGRFPRGPGSEDWGTPASEGPSDPLARTGGRYLRTVPEVVRDEHVGVGAQAPWGRIEYVPRADRSGYEIRALDVDDDVICIVSRPVPTTAVPCMK
jgi:type II secretory pathway pseudopilin PulG